MSCLSTQFTRIGGDVKLSASRVSDFTASFAMVCGTGIGYEFLYARDGILLTADGGKIIVKKRL